jgi:hypothetical protein
MNTLDSALIIEKDSNNDVMITWGYPILDATHKDVALQRCPLQNVALTTEKNFIFSKYEDLYLYTFTQQVPQSGKIYVQAISVSVFAKEYFPEKYSELLQIMAKTYISNNFDATKVQEVYLAAFCYGKVGSFASGNFDARKAKIGNVALVIDLFKEEVVKIWTALLLKKRILVYSEDVTELNTFVSALPCLVWHRQQWDIIRPLVNLSNKIETTDLNTIGVYIAGTIDSSAKNNTKYYDLFLDLASQRVIVAEQAANDFKLIKVHKDLAELVLSEGKHFFFFI